MSFIDDLVDYANTMAQPEMAVANANVDAVNDIAGTDYRRAGKKQVRRRQSQIPRFAKAVGEGAAALASLQGTGQAEAQADMTQNLVEGNYGMAPHVRNAVGDYAWDLGNDMAVAAGSGAINAADMMAGAANWLTQDQFDLGVHDTLEGASKSLEDTFYSDEMKRQLAARQAYSNAGELWDTGNLWDVARTFGADAIRSAGTMVPIVATGGIVGGLGRGIPALARLAEAAPEAYATGSSTIGNMIANASDAYNDIRRAGGEQFDANTGAAFAGMVSALSDRFLGNAEASLMRGMSGTATQASREELQNILNAGRLGNFARTLGGAAKGWLGNAAGEGVEEVGVLGGKNIGTVNEDGTRQLSSARDYLNTFGTAALSALGQGVTDISENASRGMANDAMIRHVDRQTNEMAGMVNQMTPMQQAVWENQARPDSQKQSVIDLENRAKEIRDARASGETVTPEQIRQNAVNQTINEALGETQAAQPVSFADVLKAQVQDMALQDQADQAEAQQDSDNILASLVQATQAQQQQTEAMLAERQAQQEQTEAVVQQQAAQIEQQQIESEVQAQQHQEELTAQQMQHEAERQETARAVADIQMQNEAVQADNQALQEQNIAQQVQAGQALQTVQQEAQGAVAQAQAETQAVAQQAVEAIQRAEAAERAVGNIVNAVNAGRQATQQQAAVNGINNETAIPSRQQVAHFDRVKRIVKKTGLDRHLDVVQTFDELPSDVRQRVAGSLNSRADTDRIEGFFDRQSGRVYVIADNLAPERVAAVARHETIGHYGIENMVGKELMDKAVARVNEALAKGAPLLNRIAAEVDSRQPGLSDNARAKEVIAMMAEQNIHHPITRRILDAIRKFLHKIGVIRSDITDAQISTMLRDAESWLKDNGNRSWHSEQQTQQRNETNQANAASINFEVAPDPHNKEATERWNRLSDEQKLEVSMNVANRIVPTVLEGFNTNGRLGIQMGGYLGVTNPSLKLTVDSPGSAIDIAKMLGYALNQDSMMVMSDEQIPGSESVGAVTVSLPKAWGQKEISDFYDRLWELKDNNGNNLVGGHSTSDGKMVILNYSDLTDSELSDKIKEVAGEFDVSTSTIFSAFPDHNDYNYEGKNEYADSIRSQATQELERELAEAEGSRIPASQKAVGQGTRPREEGNVQQSTERLLDSEDGGTVSYQLRNDRRGLESRPRPDGGSGNEHFSTQRLKASSLGTVSARYGKIRENSTQVLGVHYSHARRNTLDGRFYGTGLKGAEAKSLASASDPRLRERIYFYVDTGNGIEPESGVGSHVHAVHLNNVYDILTDPLRLREAAHQQTKNQIDYENLLESMIIDAGFDGYYSSRAMGLENSLYGETKYMGVAILLGRNTPTVEHKGTHYATTTKYRPPETSTEKQYAFPISWEEFRNLPNDIKNKLNEAAPGNRFLGKGLVVRESQIEAVRKILGDKTSGEPVLFSMSKQPNNTNINNIPPQVQWQPKEQGWAAEKGTNIVRALQDKMVDVKRVQNAILEAALGRKPGKLDDLEDDVNVYQKEEMYAAKVTDRINNLNNHYTKPVLELINKMKTPGGNAMNVEDAGDWLYARHVMLDNVNQQLADIRNEQENTNAYTADDALSGMSDAEARQIYSRYANNADMQKVGRLIDKAVNEGLEGRVNDGLLSRSEANQWKKQNPHYVPLKRDEFAITDDAGNTEMVKRGNTMKGGASGVDVKGAESKRRKGSAQRATNILANTFQTLEEGIVRGEKNQIGKALVRLVNHAPNKNFWHVEEGEKFKGVDQMTGEPIFVKNSKQYADNVISVKSNGIENLVVFNPNNKLAMQVCDALKAKDANQLPWIFRATGALNRYMGGWLTSKNPVFAAFNFMRDMQHMYFNLSDTALSGKAHKVFKEYPSAMKGVWEVLRGGKESKEVEYENNLPKTDADWFREFQKSGAQTGYIDLTRDPFKRTENLQKQLDRLKEDPAKWFREAGKFLEDYNSIAENGTRLAVYKTARKEGLSRDKAADIARNITVDFNRKGNQTTLLNSLFLFANANIQGHARMIKAIVKSKKARALTVGMIGLGYGLQFLARALMGVDPDTGEDRYDQIPEYEKNGNWIIPTGTDGSYVKFPVAQGLNVLPSIGRTIGEILHLKMNGRDPDILGRAFALTANFIESFNPLGSAGSAVQAFTPTVFRPFIQIAENKKWTGTPLYNDHKKSIPSFRQAFRSTSPVFIQASKFLNTITGGDEEKKGKLDLPPEAVKLLVETFALPGWSTYASQAIKTYERYQQKGGDASKLEGDELPVVNRLVGNASSGKNVAMMKYTREDQVKPVVEEIDRRMKTLYELYDEGKDTKEAYEKTKDTFRQLGEGSVNKGVAIYDMYREYRSAMTQLNKDFKEQVGKHPTPRQMGKLEQYKDQLNREFLKELNKIRKGQTEAP